MIDDLQAWGLDPADGLTPAESGAAIGVGPDFFAEHVVDELRVVRKALKPRDVRYCRREGCKTRVMADVEFCARHGDLRRTERRQINARRPGNALSAEAGAYGATEARFPICATEFPFRATCATARPLRFAASTAARSGAGGLGSRAKSTA